MVRVAEELRKLSLPLLGGTLGPCTMQASESYFTARITFLRGLEYPVTEIDLHSRQAYDTWA